MAPGSSAEPVLGKPEVCVTLERLCVSHRSDLSKARGKGRDPAGMNRVALHWRAGDTQGFPLSTMARGLQELPLVSCSHICSHLCRSRGFRQEGSSESVCEVGFNNHGHRCEEKEIFHPLSVHRNGLFVQPEQPNDIFQIQLEAF